MNDTLESLFGVELFMMSDESNTLPTSYPLRATDAIRRPAVARAGQLLRPTAS